MFTWINKEQHFHSEWALFIAFLIANLELFEPATLKQIRECADWQVWWKIMKNEYKFLIINDIWQLLLLLSDVKSLWDKWVYKLKWKIKGEIICYKICYVMWKFEQWESVNYDEIFTAVIKLMSYKLLFALAAVLDLKIEQMNVKIAFYMTELTWMSELNSLKTLKTVSNNTAS